MHLLLRSAVLISLVGLGSVSGARMAAAGVTPPDSSIYTPQTLRAALLQPLDAETQQAEQVQGQRRSVPLAFALSAVVPGAGQAYNGHWVKAGVALLVEALTVGGYISWRQQGLNEEEVYEAYAHQHWNPLAYASWLNTFKSYLNERYPGRTITAPDVQPVTGIDFSQPEAWSAADRQAAHELFSQIRAIEDQAFHPETGASFSHKLPYFGEQQYYELIGKYYQFAPGWEDYPAYLDENGAYTQAIDPNMSGPDYTHPNVQGRFYEYAEDHAHANDLFRRAQRISAIIIVNHLVSAVDAAVFARIHNNRISARMEMVALPGEPPQPMPVVRVRL